MSTAIEVEESIPINREAKPQTIIRDSRSPVFVVCTSSLKRTRIALENARQLAEQSNCGIELLAVRTVPFTQPVDSPNVPVEFLVKRLKEISSLGSERTKISIYFCREPMEALRRAIKPNSRVVMGLRKGWWPTRDKRLVRKLRRDGYTVIPVDSE